MVRTYKFEVGPVVDQLDRILQMELAGVVYYTHYSFMVWNRPGIWGIVTIGIRPVGYVAGWGFTDGMDAAFSWDGD